MTTTIDLSVFKKWRDDIQEIETLLGQYADTSPEVSEAAELLTQLNLVKRDVSVMYDSFAHKVGVLMGNMGVVETMSGATIEKKTGADRKKWEHSKLASAVAERLSDMSVDIGKLGEIGINPDSYCEQGDYKTSIIVRLGDKNK